MLCVYKTAANGSGMIGLVGLANEFKIGLAPGPIHSDVIASFIINGRLW